MERPWKQTILRRGGCESALKLRGVWEGDRPGSQGGLRKRGPWWNEAPTSRIERASVGNSPPKVMRAADLSRPLTPLSDFGRMLTCLREAEALAVALDDSRRLGRVSRFL